MKTKNRQIIVNFANKAFLSNQEYTIIRPDDSKKPLKLSKEELGRNTWALLHSIGASYPSIAQTEDKEALDMLFKSM